MAMQTPLQPGESLVKEARANLQRGAEAVGGHVYLTDRRLLFESHRFNIQRGATEVPLSAIADVGKTWTKFLGVIPIAPNSIAIRTSAGDEFKLVCNKRDTWIDAIDGQRAVAGQG